MLEIISKIEPIWTIILVPIWQEIIFRYLPYKLWHLKGGNFLLIGIVSSIIFALIHWYFGIWFVILAFLFGFIYWIVMVKFGLLAAILIHAAVNIIVLTFDLKSLIGNL